MFKYLLIFCFFLSYFYGTLFAHEYVRRESTCVYQACLDYLRLLEKSSHPILEEATLISIVDRCTDDYKKALFIKILYKMAIYVAERTDFDVPVSEFYVSSTKSYVFEDELIDNCQALEMELTTQTDYSRNAIRPLKEWLCTEKPSDVSEATFLMQEWAIDPLKNMNRQLIKILQQELWNHKSNISLKSLYLWKLLHGGLSKYSKQEERSSWIEKGIKRLVNFAIDFGPAPAEADPLHDPDRLKALAHSLCCIVETMPKTPLSCKARKHLDDVYATMEASYQKVCDQACIAQTMEVKKAF